VRGYKEKGNINTPMELAIYNEIDRFSLAIGAIDRVPKRQNIVGNAKEIPEPLPSRLRPLRHALAGGSLKLASNIVLPHA
jgi:phosphoketolase